MENPCELNDLTNLTNAQILEMIIGCPLKITEAHRRQLLEANDPFNLFEELRILIKRIFDINEKTLLAQSDATTGFMGFFNKISQGLRYTYYNNKIKSLAFKRNLEEHCVIVAEGDSWFQFPVFVKDTIDWLRSRNDHFAVYSIAFAGDWLTNMIYDGKYIEELSIHKPDVFLISGGGNDLVGSNRIAIMVDLKSNCIKYNDPKEIPDLDQVSLLDKEEIYSVQEYINCEFYSFLLVMELQYRKIITGIGKKYTDMMILTHGYDFAIPSYKRSFDPAYPLKPLINWFTGTGKWMARPLRIKGIYEDTLQRKIIKAFIFELNLMLNRLHEEYPNFYHVNALHTTQKTTDWFDELHLKSHVFKKVAQAFEIAIHDHTSRVRRKETKMAAKSVEKPGKKKYVVSKLDQNT